MSTLLVLVAAIVLLGLVFFWSGRFGGKGRIGGTSLRRGPRAHTLSNGQPKKSFANKTDAESRSRILQSRDGSPMSVYQCDTCAKWHIGHKG